MRGKQQYSLVIFKNDTNAEGVLKDGARLHIARRLAGTKKLTIVACGRQAKVQYWIDFSRLSWHSQSGMICDMCHAIYTEQRASQAAEWRGIARMSRASNTGPTESHPQQQQEKNRDGQGA